MNNNQQAMQNDQKNGIKVNNEKFSEQFLSNNQKIRQYLISYTRQRIVKAIKVPVLQTNHYHRQLKKIRLLLDVNNLQKIIDCLPQMKIILVEKQFKWQLIQIFKNDKKQQKNNQLNKKCQIIEYKIKLDQRNFDTQQLFQLFTQNNKIPYPNSFETVGHLAHFNLTAQQIPYAYVIGQITLLKAPNITCVMNKTQKLHNIYRTPTLQMMAGIRQTKVKLKQVGTIFQFDFQKVYWCSRLQQQRDRLLKKMNKNQTLADIFCGCGPLAIRAAKKGLNVIANDLNPYGYQYLIENAKLNKVQNNMICYNMCARQAMRKIYFQRLTFQQKFKTIDHIYMNLPVDAIQFLDVLQNYQQQMNKNTNQLNKINKMPLVHVNCFVVADSDQKSKILLTQRIQKVLPGFKQQQILQMHLIKNVTIIMRMYCVTFRLKSKYQLNHINQQQQKINGKKKIKTQ